MKTETIYRKVLVEDRHVGEIKLCFRGNDEFYGVIYLNNYSCEWYCEDEEYNRIYGEYPTITHTIEPIELPSEEQIESKARDDWYTDLEETLQPFKEGANYILVFINNKK